MRRCLPFFCWFRSSRLGTFLTGSCLRMSLLPRGRAPSQRQLRSSYLKIYQIRHKSSIYIQSKLIINHSMLFLNLKYQHFHYFLRGSSNQGIVVFDLTIFWQLSQIFLMYFNCSYVISHLCKKSSSLFLASMTYCFDYAVSQAFYSLVRDLYFSSASSYQPAFLQCQLFLRNIVKEERCFDVGIKWLAINSLCSLQNFSFQAIISSLTFDFSFVSIFFHIQAMKLKVFYFLSLFFKQYCFTKQLKALVFSSIIIVSKQVSLYLLHFYKQRACFFQYSYFAFTQSQLLAQIFFLISL